MNLNEQEIDDIRDYIKERRLDDTARALIESRMLTDEGFREEVEMQKLLIQAVANRGDAELMAWIKTLPTEGCEMAQKEVVPDSKLSPNEPSLNHKWRYMIAVALVFMFILAALSLISYILGQRKIRQEKLIQADLMRKDSIRRDSILRDSIKIDLMIKRELARMDSIRRNSSIRTGSVKTIKTKTKTATRDDIYASVAEKNINDYYNIFLNNTKTTGTSPSDTLPNFKNIEQALSDEDYRQALILLEPLVSNNNPNPQALELAAYAHARNKNYERALQTYTRYVEITGKTDKTSWYLCVFYLYNYNKDKRQFRVLLAEILSDKEHAYHERAKSLQIDLDNINNIKK
jgi:hypothetical protein